MEPNLPINKHHRRRKRQTVFGSVFGLVVAAVYLALNPHAASQLHSIAAPGTAIVTRAIDGDTLSVKIDGQTETVRLIGVDTPETHDPRKAVQCFGLSAAAYTKKLAEGKQVRLEADPQDSNRDKYHRLLRYVYLPDGTLLNKQLIKNGYGFAYTIFPFAKLEEFRAAETYARTNNLGLWAGCHINESTQIKQTQAQP